MKRSIYTYIVLIFTLLSVSFSPMCLIAISADTSDTTRLSEVFHSDFEDNSFDEWHVNGSGQLVIDSQNAYSGNVSISTVGRIQSWNGPSLTTTSYIAPENTYYFEGYVFHQSEIEETISWSVKWVNSDGTTTFNNIASETIQPNTWTKLTGSVEAPLNVASSDIYFESQNTNLIFNIDNIYIFGDSSFDVSSAEEVKTAEFGYDFEEDTENWVQRGDIEISRTDAYSCSGKYSLYTTGRTETWNGPAVNINSIQRNTSYLYSANVMYTGNDLSDSHTFLLQLQYEYNGNVSYEVIARKKIQKNSWSKIQGEYTLPEDAKNVMFYIQTEQINVEFATADDLMPFYIDKIDIIDSTVMNRKKTMKTLFYILIGIVSVSVIALIVILILRSKKKTQEALLLASKDAMTKAFNRNTYEEKMTWLENNPDKCKTVFVAVCDVNFLKHLNDNYGHKEGDSAIIRCAQSLITALGKKGDVYRTGGDEFVCISNTPIKKEITQQLAIESQKYQGYPFSVAVGFASYNESLDGICPDIRAIVKRADTDMYLNKESIKKKYPEFARK
ncbi:MAG: diguanylate cyclase [Ruminococcus sp.]|nr:diguanylate cyclase [Ruminococcus sp.]